jgi:ribosomal protein S18 acetylase RimI-like enzyme
MTAVPIDSDTNGSAANGGTADTDAPKPRTRLPPTEIREMELADLPAVFALGEDLFTADDYPTLYRMWDDYELAVRFASESDLCFVAEMGDRIVGFTLGTMLEKKGSAWTYGHLLWLGVDPKAGRRGIGRRLVEKITEAFIEAGARILIVDTEAENVGAIKFFRGLGFGDDNPHVYLQKNLTDDPDYIEHRKQERHARRRRQTGTR